MPCSCARAAPSGWSRPSCRSPRTVSSATGATMVVDIDAAATIGPRNLTITTGTGVSSLVNGFSVTARVNQPPIVNAESDQYINIPAFFLDPRMGMTSRCLGTSGGPGSLPRGVNDSAEVVGEAQDAGGNWAAVPWKNGQMQDLGTLGGLSGNGSGINAAGQIVGESQRADGSCRIVRYNEGNIEDLVPALHPGFFYAEGSITLGMSLELAREDRQFCIQAG